MERVASLTEFSPNVRFGILQDFPWSTGTALGGGQDVEVFSEMEASFSREVAMWGVK